MSITTFFVNKKKYRYFLVEKKASYLVLRSTFSIE